MVVRKAEAADLEEILEIYAFARERMKQTGNPTQWGDTYPAAKMLEDDIEKGQLYLVCREDGALLGVFAFIIGPDATYSRIEDGSWLSDELYGTIHRAAAGPKGRHIMPVVFDYCRGRIANLRIDTHEDNKIMQHVVEKAGFVRCGRIHTYDGSPRIAYQRCG